MHLAKPLVIKKKKEESSNLEGHCQENVRNSNICSVWGGIAFFSRREAEGKRFLFKHSPNLQLVNFLLSSGLWFLLLFAFHLQICFVSPLLLCLFFSLL